MITNVVCMETSIIDVDRDISLDKMVDKSNANAETSLTGSQYQGSRLGKEKPIVDG